MPYNIEAFHISSEEFSSYSMVGAEGQDKKWIENLSEINVFIGANNSGKSRFLRTLFGEEVPYRTRNVDLQKVNSLIDETLDKLLSTQRNMRLSVQQLTQAIDEAKSKLSNIEHFTYGKFSKDNLSSPIMNVGRATDAVISSSQVFDSVQKEGFSIVRELCEVYLDQLNELLPDEVSYTQLERPLEKKYIPILRGLRPLHKSDDSYLERTKQDYFPDMNDAKDRIFTGLHLYEETKKLLLGQRSDREKVRAFENFLSETFFQGKEVNIVPRDGKDVLYIGIGGGDEYPIYDLGDGIQSIIILTNSLFFNQGQNLLFFIEEPEHGLHPGMQRVFMETLMREEFNSFQYFLTTHSNHLLDITLDIEQVSVYTFKEDNTATEESRFSIENVDNDHTNSLELIGVRNSSVFLSNCTIWVEGITDRIYLRRYLDVYQRGKEPKFKEDLHYSFVEYAGGNITHWSFLESADPNHPNIEVEHLCAKLFLISDKDGAGLKKDGTSDKRCKKKQERHEQLKERLSDRYYCLPCREIENLLSPEVLEQVILEYEKPEVAPDFGDLVYEKYKDEYLGKFIDDKVSGINRSYKSDSGTIKDKVNFAKKAVAHIHSIDDLPEEAKKLTEGLYEFIKSNNP